MDIPSIRVTGSRRSLEELRAALLAELQGQSVQVTELVAEPAESKDIRVRGLGGLEDPVVSFLVNVFARATYDAAHAIIKRLKKPGDGTSANDVPKKTP